MWIYAFGSLVRGEIDPESDIDLLFIGSPSEARSVPPNVQRYTKTEIESIFRSGDLFAHHLSVESKLLHSTSGTDILRDLGPPNIYTEWKPDLDKFVAVLGYSIDMLVRYNGSVFHRGLAYMSTRDIAMIYSHVNMGIRNFSKYTAYQIDIPLGVPKEEYECLRKCRLASTRGSWVESMTKTIDASVLAGLSDWIVEIQNWRNTHA